MPQKFVPKKTEVLCPMNHPFTRDNGQCCFGGTHRIDGSRKDEVSETKEITFADGKTSKGSFPAVNEEGVCKKGYMYEREAGHRCKGGDHFTDVPADEVFTNAAVKGCGEVARKNVKYPTGKCKAGFPFDREEAQRCSGGSHRVDVPQDEVFGVDLARGNGTLKDQWWKKGAPQCNHNYQYSREEGRRCAGGSHHVSGAHYDPAIHSPDAGKPKMKPLPRECPDGYKFEREHGTRCKGGSHFRRYE